MRFTRFSFLLFSLLFSVFLVRGQNKVKKNAYIPFNYPVNYNGFPNDLVAGPDGAMWFVDYTFAHIGRITIQGVFTLFPAPQGPFHITSGPDGALWFTEPGANQIGRITTSGQITEFPIPTSNAGSFYIAAGPDNALWFTEEDVNQIGRIDLAGNIMEFPIPNAASDLQAIVAGPDHALWFAESASNKIGRITTSGVVSEFAIPTLGRISSITVGSDGALWFTQSMASVLQGNIGRITTSGSITEFPLGPIEPAAITAGPDGALWFTYSLSINFASLGRLTTAGVLTGLGSTDWLIHGAGENIASGPDGALWFIMRPLGTDFSTTILRAPACGLGLNLAIANNTLTVSFDLGSPVPTTWNVWYDTGSGLVQTLSKPLPPVTPSTPFRIPITLPSNVTTVRVESGLQSSTGQYLCVEGASIQ